MDEKRWEISAVVRPNEGSSAAVFIRILAWMTWIGGSFVAYQGAQVEAVSRYSAETEFGFVTFISLALVYWIIGGVLRCSAELLENIHTIAHNTTSLCRMTLKEKEQ